MHFHVNILRHSTERFNFRSGSVGNFFFAGARVFFRSLEAAIFLFSRVARIPEGSLVLPAVCTEERLGLAAELADGSVLLGQNAISHPCAPGSAGTPQEVEKQRWDSLPSPVRRVFYLAAEGDRQEHEVAPAPNPRVLAEVGRADAIVYGMGSLYTSLAPSLVLKGVGEAVAERNCPKVGRRAAAAALALPRWRLHVCLAVSTRRPPSTTAEGGELAACRSRGAHPSPPTLCPRVRAPYSAPPPQILLLNGGLDREMSSCQGHPGPMAAADVVLALCGALNRRGASSRAGQLEHPPSAYVTAVVVPRGGPIRVDEGALRALGVARVVEVAAERGWDGAALYEPDALVAAIGGIVRGEG